MNERLKAIRNELNMTQAEFAQALGTSRTAYAKYETNLVVPSDTFIRLLCEKFGINENWLRTGQGEPKTSDALEKVIESYGLDENQARLLKVFMSFPPEDRQTLAQAFFLIYDHDHEAKAAAKAAAESPDETRRKVRDARTNVAQEKATS